MAAVVAVVVAVAAVAAVAVAVAVVVAVPVVDRHMVGHREASCKHCIARQTRGQQGNQSELLTTCHPGMCPHTGRICGSLQDPV